MDKIKIVIADDHALVLDALLLLSEGAFEVIGKAENGKELLQLAERCTPDVYVIDINMPGLGGIEAAKALREMTPDARILFISGDGSARVIREAVNSGCQGFISKHAPYQELASAIEAVAHGEKFLAPSAREELERNGQDALSSLTPRQISVLQLIAEGLTAKEIAYRLGLSPRTAEFHRQCIMERLDLHSTAELTRFAIDAGLIGITPEKRVSPTRTQAAVNASFGG